MYRELTELSLEQIDALLEIGLRPIEIPYQFPKGDAIAGYMLIPTKYSKWWAVDDSNNGSSESTWEGSYIPLIIYKQNRACILVSYGKEELWQKALANPLADILNMAVVARGD